MNKYFFKKSLWNKLQRLVFEKKMDADQLAPWLKVQVTKDWWSESDLWNLCKDELKK